MDLYGKNISFFKQLSNEKEQINSSDLKALLTNNGFLSDDPKWSKCFEILNLVDKLDEAIFSKVFSHFGHDFMNIISGDLIIPDFSSFKEEIKTMFEEAKKNKSGEVANYIPQLGTVDPEKFGLSMCTVDGQRLNFGDCTEDFSIQSCCKPILYSMALETLGEEYVHKYVDKEPSGQAFNAMVLTQDNLPFNPMLNAGAIMICSLLGRNLGASEKFDKLMQWNRRLAGGVKPGFNNSVYLSEKKTADKNFAMAYLMKSQGGFPENTDIMEVLEFYFQSCSIEMNCRSLAILASTLANGGVCPITKERVLSTNTTKSVLSLMFSCGMYDYSGQFAFTVGLPAKSGVSGAIMLVVPTVCGFCIWSPRLDKLGNSQRGLDFCRALVSKFNFHNFDNLINNDSLSKVDPRKNKKSTKFLMITEFLYACMENDLNTVKKMLVEDFDVNFADYDKRSGLHIAASEGHLEICKYLLEKGANTNLRDRWNNTPLDDAIKSNQFLIIDLLSVSKVEQQSKALSSY